MIDSQSSSNSQNGNDSGFYSSVLWLLKGFLYPCWSGTFYKRASTKRVFVAVVFLFLFAVAQTSVTAVQVIVVMKDTGDGIEEAYDRGEFPTIVIEDGLASTDGQQPYIYSSGRDLIAVDTTGSIQEIDTSRYSRGFLLTRTEIHFVNEDGYQVYQLVDLHESFGNPIVLDKDQVLEFWSTLALIINLVATVGVFIWNSFVRLSYIAAVGLLLWGVASLIRQGVGFGQILITGIYANVPTIYIVFALGQIGVRFFGLYTILLILVWAIALRIVLKAKDAESEMIDVEVASV